MKYLIKSLLIIIKKNNFFRQKVHIQLADPKNTLYIGSLPKHLIQDQIKQIILEQGKVIDVFI